MCSAYAYTYIPDTAGTTPEVHNVQLNLAAPWRGCCGRVSSKPNPKKPDPDTLYMHKRMHAQEYAGAVHQNLIPPHSACANYSVRVSSIGALHPLATPSVRCIHLQNKHQPTSHHVTATASWARSMCHHADCHVMTSMEQGLPWHLLRPHSYRMLRRHTNCRAIIPNAASSHQPLGHHTECSVVTPAAGPSYRMQRRHTSRWAIIPTAVSQCAATRTTMASQSVQ
jgi:hypothetical protein